MRRATVAFVLHAHLPWVDPRADDDTIEGRWLLQALAEAYLPLLALLERHEADGLPARLTLSLTPTLIAQLRHPTLADRFRRHLDRLDAVLDAETRRLRGTALAGLVPWHRARVRAARTRFFTDGGGDPVATVRRLARAGRIEIAASAATHAVLSLLPAASTSLRLQVGMGMAAARRAFGRAPETFWLPECAYDPSLDGVLASAGVGRVVVDTHAVLHGTPAPVYGAHAPVASPAGVIAFPREPEGSAQVWSSDGGYPGDPWYADFHSDLGWSAPDALDAVFPLPPGGAPVGVRHHRVTGPGVAKAPYEPGPAGARVIEHARHFVGEASRRAAALAGVLDRPPLFLYAFDAELFGHWWLEGPQWLDAVLRELAGHPSLAARTLGDELTAHPAIQQVQPAPSTWGAGGHHAVWLRPDGWPHDELAALDAEIDALAAVAPSHPGLRTARAHLLLAQSSDWTFMMARGASGSYGRRRLAGHLAASRRACEAIRRGTALDPSDPVDDRLFPEDDPDDFS